MWPRSVSRAIPTHHLVASGPGRGSPLLVSTSVSSLVPSRLPRMTRIPSRSDQYSLPFFLSSWSCFGVCVPPDGTIVVIFSRQGPRELFRHHSRSGRPCSSSRCGLRRNRRRCRREFFGLRSGSSSAPCHRDCKTTRVRWRQREKTSAQPSSSAWVSGILVLVSSFHHRLPPTT